MKTVLAASAAVAALLALTACNNAAPAADNAASSASAAGSDAAASANSAVNTAQDATAGVVGQVSANGLGSVSTDQFVPNAARSDMYEIQASQMAETRSHNREITALARMLVTDHRASTAGLQRAVRAGAVNTTIPTALDDRRQGMINNLRDASAADFDGVWVTQQIAAHEEALALMTGFADRGDNDALKAAARTTAPVVQRHLDALHRIQSAMSGGSAASGSGSTSASGAMAH